MNAILQQQLDGVEAALNTLTESITSHNPSLDAAKELLAADDALSHGLEKLTTHQNNYRRITELEAASAALDRRFTDALSLLATTRAEILATPVSGASSGFSSSSSSSRAVPVDELLAYARNTARFAAPLSYRPPTVAGLPITTHGQQQQQQQQQQQGTVESNVLGTGAQTETQPTPSATTTAAAAAGAGPDNPSLSFLSDAERAWLDPLTQIPFLPWPSEEMIARSGLARSQNWGGAVPPEGGAEGQQGQTSDGIAPGGGGGGDAGLGPDIVNGGATDAKMEDLGAAVEGEQSARKKTTAEEKAEQQQQQQQQQRRRSTLDRPPEQATQEKPKVFTGLDLYDPDSE